MITTGKRSASFSSMMREPDAENPLWLHESAHLRMGFQPFLARARVALADHIPMFVLGHFAVAARVSAHVPAVVASDGLRSHFKGKIAAALLAQQILAGDDIGLLEYVQRTAIFACGRFQRCRLTSAAHGVAYPTSARHSGFLSLPNGPRDSRYRLAIAFPSCSSSPAWKPASPSPSALAPTSRAKASSSGAR